MNKTLLLSAFVAISVTVFAQNVFAGLPGILFLREALPYNAKTLPVPRGDVYGKKKLQVLPLPLIDGQPDPSSLNFQAAHLATQRVPGTVTMKVSFPGVAGGGSIQLSEEQRISVLKELLKDGLDGYGRVIKSHNMEAVQKYIVALFPGSNRHDQQIAQLFAAAQPEVAESANNFSRPQTIVDHFNELLVLTESLRSAVSIYARIQNDSPIKDRLEAAVRDVAKQSIETVVQSIEGQNHGRWVRFPRMSSRLSQTQIEGYKKRLVGLVAKSLLIDANPSERVALSHLLAGFIDEFGVDTNRHSVLRYAFPPNLLFDILEKLVASREQIGALRHASQLLCSVILQER